MFVSVEWTWLETELAAGRSIEAIARMVGRDPSTIAYWVHKHGLVSQHSAKHAARGGIDREVLAPLVERGLSVQQIAEELGVGGTTVRHWLRKHGLATVWATRAIVPAARPGSIVRTCRRHGATTFGAVATASATGVGFAVSRRCRRGDDASSGS